jgi:hypothetical protein
MGPIDKGYMIHPSSYRWGQPGTSSNPPHSGATIGHVWSEWRAPTPDNIQVYYGWTDEWHFSVGGSSIKKWLDETVGKFNWDLIAFPDSTEFDTFKANHGFKLPPAFIMFNTEENLVLYKMKWHDRLHDYSD